MTPQERQLVTELFDRLAQLEGSKRDRDAEHLIAELSTKAPNAIYALVQSVLVQEEALKRANDHIEELEAELGIEPDEPEHSGSFLDSMRERMLGRSEAPRGSVPSVRSGDQPMGAPDLSRGSDQRQAGWSSAASDPQRQEPGTGSSFLGTAAAAAAGVVGGAVLMQGIRSLFEDSGSAHAKAFDPGLSSSGSSGPWGGGSDLANQAGVNDIGGASADEGTGFVNGDDTGGFDDGGFDFGDLD